jgi:hypothetical protein
MRCGDRKLVFLVMALAGLGLAACEGSLSVSSHDPGQTGQTESAITQTEFDLTVDEDRAHFKEQGLTYHGSIGPYAIYKVTSANPRLLGPRVRVQRAAGDTYAMLCGGTAYFTNYEQAPQAKFRLHGGPDGQSPLATSPLSAQPQKSCAEAKDSFGHELPPEDNPPERQPPPAVISDPTDTEQLGISLDPAPPMGSTVLLRRVAFAMQKTHNQSHVIPRICCDGDSCNLNDLP